jgi:hypothetical protein
MGSANRPAPAASWLLIGGGLALAVLTFVTWFDVGGVDRNAWEALRRTDVVVFGAGVVAAACGAWLAFGDVGPEGRVVALLGIAAAVVGALVVVVRMISPPGDGDLAFGVFLALAAAALAAVGGVLALTSSGGAGPGGSGPPAGTPGA